MKGPVKCFNEISWLIFLSTFLQLVKGQFYNIYPAAEVVPNTLSLNSTTLNIGAFLALTAAAGEVKLQRTSTDIICMECQKEIINSDPDLLPDMKLEILYYDTSVVNTSKASMSALEYALTPSHIATLGPDSADLLLPITKFLQSLRIATYSPRQLSSTFSSPINFPNLRTITVSDYYLTQNYVQLMKFFGWTWIAAAFADDDVGQSGRYSFAQFSNSGLNFPCFYIVGSQNDAGLNALSSCIQNNTDIKVLLLWGSAAVVADSIKYLYDKTNLTYLTYVMNPTAATGINFNVLKVPPIFYQGSIFLGENYDEDSGYYDCLDKFFTDPSSLNENARLAYEAEYNCVLTTDESLPRCETVFNDKKDVKCRCLIDDYRSISKPYTV